MPKTMNEILFHTSSLCLFRSVADARAVSLLCQMAAAGGAREAASAYGQLYSLLCENDQTLSQHLYTLASEDDNPFMRACASKPLAAVPATLIDGARYDLEILYRLSQISAPKIKQALAKAHPGQEEALLALPCFPGGSPRDAADWSAEGFAAYARQNGFGVYAKYRAFSFANGALAPIAKPDPIRLADLKGYEVQRGKVIQNTERFLQGLPAHNALLYGDRGTGKSSTVKALLNAYARRGLRMIELSKAGVAELGALIRLIEGVPLRFIVFIDDLTFEENDEGFGVLKAALEGSLLARPENMVIYATTNRRHLIKETFRAREGDEVHRGDAIDESLSLSDRFGLYLTFSLPAKDEYLHIVSLLARDRGIQTDEQALHAGAERFALLRAGRSPRLARQYIDYISAENAAERT